MSSRIHAFVFLCLRLTLSLVLAVSLMPSPASAGSLSANTVAKVQRAITFQQQNKWQEARAVLEGMPTANLYPAKNYDAAFVHRMLGSLYWQLEEPNKAIKALRSAVDSHELEQSAQRSAQRMLADILLSQARYDEALTRYYSLTADKPQASSDQSVLTKELADIWLRIAQAHYQNQQAKQALRAVEKHLSLTAAKVSSLSLKLGAQITLKHWKGSIMTLKQLLRLEPTNKTWWLQLAGSYQQLNQPAKMLNTLVLATREGIKLSSSEKKMMAQLYAQQGVPEKAAALMHELNADEAKAGSLAIEASYWHKAKEWENAMASWQRAAEKDNQYRLALAQLQLQRGLYRDALVNFALVTEQNQEAPVALAQAMAYAKLGDLDNALQHAKRAHEIEPTAQSESWIQYLSH
ncbi:tetratricopeptide repeat protein [Enterovibrio sp. 27052020O]|uniref:tetratricopeptide repeat protein n=1 Tax=Enterovibrio sp. 27052020O TaxID=3241166 RepID=UPI003890961F